MAHKGKYTAEQSKTLKAKGVKPGTTAAHKAAKRRKIGTSDGFMRV